MAFLGPWRWLYDGGDTTQQVTDAIQPDSNGAIADISVRSIPSASWVLDTQSGTKVFQKVILEVVA